MHGHGHAPRSKRWRVGGAILAAAAVGLTAGRLGADALSPSQHASHPRVVSRRHMPGGEILTTIRDGRQTYSFLASASSRPRFSSTSSRFDGKASASVSGVNAKTTPVKAATPKMIYEDFVAMGFTKATARAASGYTPHSHRH